MKKKQTNEYIKKLQLERIRECMHESGLTQKQIAENLNYTEQHISYVFNGKRALTVEMATELAKIFSKNRNKKTVFVDIPYNELSETDKVNYSPNDNGDVSMPFDISDDIDYRYLLGEKKYKTRYENFDEPLEENENYLFQNGIKAILYKNGFVLCADNYIGIDCKILEKVVLNKTSPVNGIMCKDFLKVDEKLKLIKLSTGETFLLSRLELFQLINDYEQAITAITERFFEKAIIKQALCTPPKDTPKEDIPFY